MDQDMQILLFMIFLVFAGSGPKKKTETKLNTTEKDQTNSCGCTNSEVFQLPVTRFYVIWKDH